MAPTRELSNLPGNLVFGRPTPLGQPTSVVVPSSHSELHDMSSHTDRHKGADIASASTITPGTDGDYYDITGTTEITAIATRAAGDEIKLQFDDALNLKHTTGVLDLRGKIDLVTSTGTVVAFVSEGSGAWRELYRNSTRDGLLQGAEAGALQVVVETVAGSAVKQEVSGQSIAAGALQVVVETTTAVAIDST